MKLTDKQISFMQEDLCIELAGILMEEHRYTMTEALGVLYNSQTFDRLSNPATGLYYQSAGYVYDCLNNEIKTGVLR